MVGAVVVCDDVIVSGLVVDWVAIGCVVVVAAAVVVVGGNVVSV